MSTNASKRLPFLTAVWTHCWEENQEYKICFTDLQCPQLALKCRILRVFVLQGCEHKHSAWFIWIFCKHSPLKFKVHFILRSASSTRLNTIALSLGPKRSLPLAGKRKVCVRTWERVACRLVSFGDVINSRHNSVSGKRRPGN